MGCLHTSHLVPQRQISHRKGPKNSGLFVGMTAFCSHPLRWAGLGLNDLSSGNNALIGPVDFPQPETMISNRVHPQNCQF